MDKIVRTSFLLFFQSPIKSYLCDPEVIGGKNKNIHNSQQCWIPKNNPLTK